MPAGALRGANVLLVTIDTLRADRVGSARALTPTIDDFASTGLRFEHAYAHVPLTLPSHAALMTGAYPTRNGVRDNGTFRLGERLADARGGAEDHGYRTGAFVGAFVLDARFGLNRGFDLYDDRMREPDHAADLDVVQRTAEQVLAPAEEWILNRASTHPPSASPWFAWIHLYDPHEPYRPSRTVSLSLRRRAVRRRGGLRRCRAWRLRRAPPRRRRPRAHAGRHRVRSRRVSGRAR
jgi:arylsulfatase A-like enzyme